MSFLAFGDFRPDISSYKNGSSQVITNVVPRGDGYGPFPDLLSFTSALPSPCRGYFYGRMTDGSVQLFAGTATRLYILNNTTFTWTDISLGATDYAALSSNANWQFAQFGTLILATHQNVVLQFYNMASSTAFANQAGSPPQAAYIAIVGQFVVLSGLLSAEYRAQWCGLNDPTNWVAGVNQADFQDFADGGIVRGVAGGEFGVIFQDTSIRSMVYAPGSAVVFDITRIADDLGLFAPYAIIRAGDKIFFPSAKGFHVIEQGGLPQQIGKERVDRTFLSNVDTGALQLCIGVADPADTRVAWAYKSVNGAAGLFDTILLYDYELDKFAEITGISGEYVASLAKPGITLEGLDSIAPGGIPITGAANNGSGLIRLTVATLNLPAMPTPPDGAPVPTKLTTGTKITVLGVGGTTEANGENQTITVVDATHIDLQGSAFVHAYTSGGLVAGPIDAMMQSLDSFAAVAAVALSGFNGFNQLGFFNGPNLQAILDTSDQGGDLTRIFIVGIRPDTDASAALGSVGARENLQSNPLFSSEQPINVQGICPARVSTRYGRGQIRIPYGSTWSFASGVEPIIGEEDGER